MIEALKFVQGAVSKKDFQPALTHFRLHENRVMGYNGVIALSSPINLEITASPKAIPFVKAIERCRYGNMTVHLTPGGKLGLHSGPFRAYVECLEDTEILDSIQPEGEPGPDFGNEFMAALHMLVAYVGIDASRPWATGIFIQGASAFATNNIVIAEYWLGYELPTINIPMVAINELVRIGEKPESSLIGTNSITFFFKGGRWLRSQLLSMDWPMETVQTVLNQEAEPKAFPGAFFDSVETLHPFVEEEGRIFFREGRITTNPAEGEGASVAIKGLPSYGAYHYKHLMSLNGPITKIDFSKHPRPCPFFGPKLRGVILGMVDL